MNYMYNTLRRVNFTFGFVTGILLFGTISYFQLIPWLSPATHKRKLVIFFGDSITQRGWDIDSKGFIGSMANWWTRKVDILNRGYSGYNSDWGKKIMKDAIIHEQPDLVVIFFGANDAIDGQVPQHVPLSQFEENIEYMIRSLLKAKAQVILITPPPVYEEDLEKNNLAKGKTPLRDRTNERTLLYAQSCLKLGHMYNIPVVDIFTGFDGFNENRKIYLCDGLHFSDRGNVKLFEMLMATIQIKLPQWLPENLPFEQPEWFHVVKTIRKRNK